MKRSNLIYLIIIIIYIVGIVGLSLTVCHKVFVYLSSANIMLAACLVIFYHTTSHTIAQKAQEAALLGKNATDYIVQQGMQFVFKSFLVGVFGYLLEVDGVRTGVIFGEYSYKLFDVPLILGFNWFFMVYCSTQIAYLFKLPVLPTALISGLIMTLYDLILEPNAVAMGYWTWHQGSIPLQNYIGWFFCSIILSSIFFILKFSKQNSLTKHYIIIQVMFFVLNYVIINY